MFLRHPLVKVVQLPANVVSGWASLNANQTCLSFFLVSGSGSGAYRRSC